MSRKNLTSAILTAGSGVKTRKFSRKVAAALWDCDYIKTFTEAGWFYAYGWNYVENGDDKLVVKTHMKSEDEFLRGMKRQCSEHNHRMVGKRPTFSLPDDREPYLDKTREEMMEDDKCEALERKRIHLP